MMKKILLLVFGAFLLTIPVIAAGSYPSISYPNVPAFNEKNPNGVFHVYVEKEGKWEDAGVLSFDRYFRPRALDITKHAGSGKTLKVKLKKEGGGPAHIDSALVNDRAPFRASGTDADLKKLANDDFDVADANGDHVELEFNAREGKTLLRLTARIEELVISKTPFQYPAANLYKQIGTDSKFYKYNMAKHDEGKAKLFFKEYSLSGSGHPSGYTYCWVRNDEKNLYVKMDFTPDDTMDGDKDYAKVYVKTGGGVKEFKVSVPETKWGNASFTYTDKVAYQHKVYDFAIPLKEIGIDNAKKADELTLAFAAYGTAAPPGGSFNPSSNNYLVVFNTLGDIHGQFVDSNGSAVGSEISITADVFSQAYPTSAYNSSTNQYLVVWQDRRNGTDNDIFGQLINANGTLSGGNFPISTAANDQLTPSVAYNSSTNQYLVAWGDERTGLSSDVYGQLVSATGTLVGGNFPISTALIDQMMPSIAYSSSTNQYLVVWMDSRTGAFVIYGQFVNAAGTLSGSDFPISTGTNDQYVPTVAYNGSTNQFLVVWNDYVSGTGGDVYGQLINANGTFAGSNFPISTATGNQTGASVAYNSMTNQYLVIWTDYRSGTGYDIYGQYLTGAGALTGGNFLIVNNAYSPYGMANTNLGNYLAAYYDSASSGYAWVIVGEAQRQAVAAVPAINKWGMLFFMVLSVSGAVYFLRRQRRTNS